MNTKVILFGGSGYIGTNFALGLSKFYSVTVTGRRNLNNDIFLKFCKAKINYVKLDVKQINKAKKLILQNEIICFFIPNPQPNFSHSYSEEEIKNVYEFTAYLFEFAAKNSKRIIFSSSGGSVYGNKNFHPLSESTICEPVTRYGMVKLELENLLNSNDLNSDFLIFRISNPYGSTQGGYFKSGFINNSIFNILLNKKIEIWGDGKQIRDFIHMQDLVCIGIQLIQSREKGVFNLGCGVGTSIIDVVQIMENILKENFVIQKFETFQEAIRYNVLDMNKTFSVIDKYIPKSLENGLVHEFIEFELLPKTLN